MTCSRYHRNLQCDVVVATQILIFCQYSTARIGFIATRDINNHAVIIILNKIESTLIILSTRVEPFSLCIFISIELDPDEIFLFIDY